MYCRDDFPGSDRRHIFMLCVSSPAMALRFVQVLTHGIGKISIKPTATISIAQGTLTHHRIVHSICKYRWYNREITTNRFQASLRLQVTFDISRQWSKFYSQKPFLFTYLVSELSSMLSSFFVFVVRSASIQTVHTCIQPAFIIIVIFHEIIFTFTFQANDLLHMARDLFLFIIKYLIVVKFSTLMAMAFLQYQLRILEHLLLQFSHLRSRQHSSITLRSDEFPDRRSRQILKGEQTRF